MSGRGQQAAKGTILVTAIGSFSAEAVIRIYKESGYRVLGCDIYPAEWVASSMDVDRFWQAPPATEPEAYLDFLGRVCRQEQVDYLIPLTDVEVDAVNGWRERAKEMGTVVCLSPRETILLCRDKWKMSCFLEKQRLCRNIPTKRLATVAQEEGDSGYEGLDYPLVLKPNRGRSSQGLVTVWDAGQMRYEAQRLRREASQYLVQPRISGNVVTVDVVRQIGEDAGCDRGAEAVMDGRANCGGDAVMDGRANRGGDACHDCVVCLPRRELLRTGNGAGTSVCVFRDENLEGQCAAMARALDVRGCVNFEFVEENPGTWYFLECNPRFSGGVAFSCMAGYDMVSGHLRCFSGQPIEPIGEIRRQYLVKRYAEYCTRME